MNYTYSYVDVNTCVCCHQAGYTPLHTACHFGQIAMIRFLLECAAPVDAQTKVCDTLLSYHWSAFCRLCAYQ